ncbi:MAG: MFS transporter [Myxococcales bacterium]|nr:MFS transporter [Myxococcales bacterium]
MLAAAALGLVALVRREAPRKAPLIPLDLLRDRSFRLSVIASVTCFVGQSATMLALPFHLHHGLHQSALATGLLMTPWPLTVVVVAPLAGKLSERVSGAALCAIGGALLAVGLASAALVPLHGSPLLLVPLLVVSGAGFGLFQVSNNRNMLVSAPRERSGAAGGMQATARLTGQTLGALGMTLLFALTSIERAPRLGLMIAAALTLTAGLVSTLRGHGGRSGSRDAAPRQRDGRPGFVAGDLTDGPRRASQRREHLRRVGLDLRDHRARHRERVLVDVDAEREPLFGELVPALDRGEPGQAREHGGLVLGQVDRRHLPEARIGRVFGARDLLPELARDPGSVGPAHFTQP